MGAFADWFDGRTLLYTSETTHGFAIAYDWMYAYWTQPRRDTIRTAIINKGLNTALSLYKSNFWALRTNSSSANWNMQQRHRHRSDGSGHGKRGTERGDPRTGHELDAAKSRALHHGPGDDS